MSTPQPAGVYRVEWVPGTDHLLGTCFCGAHHVGDDPVALWEWLHGHPRAHDVRPVELPRPADAQPVEVSR